MNVSKIVNITVKTIQLLSITPSSQTKCIVTSLDITPLAYRAAEVDLESSASE